MFIYIKKQEFGMEITLPFIIKSIALGAGLAMDAFSVSLANGLNEPKMKKGRMSFIAWVFAFFQFLMPVIGWVCVHTVVQYFRTFERFIPWIALVLLCFIGGKMLFEGIKNKDSEEEQPAVGFAALLVQGVATSIDALSVGFTISEYNWKEALICCLIIAVVTFFICLGGLALGKRFGTKFAGKASIFGGAILVIIGIEIFITGIL